MSLGFYSGWYSPHGEFRHAPWGHHALIAREVLEGSDSTLDTLECQCRLLGLGWIRVSVLPTTREEVVVDGKVSNHHFKAILARAKEYDDWKGEGTSDNDIAAIEAAIAEQERSNP